MLRTETVRNRANRRERDRKGAGNGLSRGSTGWRVNSNQLKLIAVAAMLVDHAAVVFDPDEEMQEAIKKFIPRTLKFEKFGRN